MFMGSFNRVWVSGFRSGLGLQRIFNWVNPLSINTSTPPPPPKKKWPPLPYSAVICNYVYTYIYIRGNLSNFACLSARTLKRRCQDTESLRQVVLLKCGASVSAISATLSGQLFREHLRRSKEGLVLCIYLRRGFPKSGNPFLVESFDRDESIPKGPSN